MISTRFNGAVSYRIMNPIGARTNYTGYTGVRATYLGDTQGTIPETSALFIIISSVHHDQSAHSTARTDFLYSG